jgi:hypothetical protein
MIMLHERPVAATMGVLCFFAVGLVGWVTGLTPYACSKRALLGAVMGYVGGSLVAKAVNAVLTNALIEHLTKSPEGQASDNQS